MKQIALMHALPVRKQMRHVALTCMVLVGSIVLLASGCATNPGAGVVPPPPIDGYALAGVDVTVGEDAWAGWFGRLDDIDDAELTAQVEEKLETALASATAHSFVGEQPARLHVHVVDMVIASGIGRAVLGRQSHIDGVVRIVDAATDDTIAKVRLNEIEKDVRFSGNVGVLIEVAKNITDAAVNDRVERVAREFAGRVSRWLDSGRAEEPSATEDDTE